MEGGGGELVSLFTSVKHFHTYHANSIFVLAIHSVIHFIIYTEIIIID